MSILPDFRLETYFSQWEFKARHHMTASDAQTISLCDLLLLAEPEEREAWDNLTLGYTETWGSPALRRAVAATYAGIAAGGHPLLRRRRDSAARCWPCSARTITPS